MDWLRNSGQLSRVLFEGSQASPACPSDNSSINLKMSVDHCCIETEVLGEKAVRM